MKKAFYYCLAIAIGASIGWFAEPNHRPQTIDQETKNTIDSLQSQLTWYQSNWGRMTDKLSQEDGE